MNVLASKKHVPIFTDYNPEPIPGFEDLGLDVQNSEPVVRNRRLQGIHNKIHASNSQSAVSDSRKSAGLSDTVYDNIPLKQEGSETRKQYKTALNNKTTHAVLDISLINEDEREGDITIAVQNKSISASPTPAKPNVQSPDLTSSKKS
jgi:hypothetical protein